LQTNRKMEPIYSRNDNELAYWQERHFYSVFQRKKMKLRPKICFSYFAFPAERYILYIIFKLALETAAGMIT